MRLQKSKPGYHKIDGLTVRTDSLMEARIMRRLVKHGFGDGRLRRYRFSIGTSLFRYTPDVHLSVFHNDIIRRALVEFKPISTRQFSEKARLRILAAAKFFRDSLCLLYVERTKCWYIIEPNGKLFRINKPMPGHVTVTKLPPPSCIYTNL